MILDEGLYIYIDGTPKKIDSLTFNEGKYIVFFDNRKCPFCRIFDVLWEVLLKDLGTKNIKFIKIVCSYFASECSNEEAKKFYVEYEIWKSPSIMLINASGKEKKVQKFTPSQYNYDLQLIKKNIKKFFNIED